MPTTIDDLFKMFYPLSQAARREWARILALPEDAYLDALNGQAVQRGLRLSVHDGVAAWRDDAGRELLLLFRLSDPGDLDAVRRVYETIAQHKAPLAYTFVHQMADGAGTWDIFHMSRLSYLAHCNRVSGPGAGAEQ